METTITGQITYVGVLCLAFSIVPWEWQDMQTVLLTLDVIRCRKMVCTSCNSGAYWCKLPARVGTDPDERPSTNQWVSLRKPQIVLYVNMLP